jgi:uncharacterized RDD family membrane protein YckC
MTCSNCGAVQATTNAFCKSCGTALDRNNCASCAQPLTADDRFCQSCGTPVATADDKAIWAPPGVAASATAPPPPGASPWQAPPSGGFAPGAGAAAPGTGYPPPGAGFAAPGVGYAPPGAGMPSGQYFQQGPAAYGPADGAALAEWGTRAGAYLLDMAIILVPFLVVGLGLGQVSVFFTIIAYLYALAFGIWFSVQVGQTGQSPGMRMVGLRCISTKTGQPIGGGLGIVRSLCHGLFSALCFVGAIVDLLFPLWDDQKQTIADKMMSTVVVTAPKQPFSLTP